MGDRVPNNIKSLLAKLFIFEFGYLFGKVMIMKMSKGNKLKSQVDVEIRIKMIILTIIFYLIIHGHYHQKSHQARRREGKPHAID